MTEIQKIMAGTRPKGETTMTTKARTNAIRPQDNNRDAGPPRARNLGWDNDEKAWRFLHLERDEVFFASSFAVTPGHYEIAGKVYRKG